MTPNSDSDQSLDNGAAPSGPDSFGSIGPEAIMTAAERCGGDATGRFFALNAMENRVYDVELEEQRVVVKFYRPARWNESQLRSEHRFLQAAVADAIPVVAPLADESGETLFKNGHVWFAVFPRRGGRLEAELNPRQLASLGHTLARLHNVAGSIPDVERPTIDLATYVDEPWQTIQDRQLVPDLWARHLTPLIGRIRDCVGPMLAGCRNQLVHGDCHVGNILWRDDDPMVIDFDDCLFGPAVQDFWMLTGGDDEDSRKKRDILIDAYTELRDFDHEELHLIEALRTMRIIRYSGWIARRWDDQSFKRMFPHFGTERWWQEQTETLSVQLEKLHGSSPT